MKKTIHGLLLALGLAVVPQAHAGWFDWFTPGEWFSGMGDSGLYAAGAFNVTKATGQLNRRLGGEGDPGGFSIEEPGFITTGFLLAGYEIFDFLAIEGRYGFPLDSDEIENGSNSQKFKMDSLYGIYLKPQLMLGDSFALFARLGYSDFEFEVRCYSSDAQRPAPTACGQDGSGNPRTRGTFADSGFAWSGGIQLRLSSQARLGFEYTQHYDEDDAQVFGVGVVATYMFGAGGDEEDDYY